MEFCLNKDGLAGPFELSESFLLDDVVASLEDGASVKNRHVTSGVCQRLLSSKQISGKIELLFGNDLVVWRTNSFKKVEGSSEIPWHHDRHFEDGDQPVDFNNLENHFSILVALSDMDEKSGLMEFILGSHLPDEDFDRDTRPFHKRAFNEHFLNIPQHLIKRKQQVPLKKGEFMLFHSGLLHRSLPSTCTKERHSFVARLCRGTTVIPEELAAAKEVLKYPFLSPNTDDLAGKVALITGGSSGIGKSIAQSLLLESCHVIVTGRNETKLASSINDLSQYAVCSKVVGFAVDASDSTAMAKMFANIHREFGCIDISFINAASNSASGDITQVDIQHWQQEVFLNISASVITAKLSAASMGERCGGNIIFIGSAIGLSGAASNSAYAAAKGACRSLAMSLAKELKDKRINVNELIPGSVKTQMNPNGQKEPNEVAALALVLAKQNLAHGASGQSLSLKNL